MCQICASNLDVCVSIITKTRCHGTWWQVVSCALSRICSSSSLRRCLGSHGIAQTNHLALKVRSHLALKVQNNIGCESGCRFTPIGTKCIIAFLYEFLLDFCFKLFPFSFPWNIHIYIFYFFSFFCSPFWRAPFYLFMYLFSLALLQGMSGLTSDIAVSLMLCILKHFH